MRAGREIEAYAREFASHDIAVSRDALNLTPLERVVGQFDRKAAARIGSGMVKTAFTVLLMVSLLGIAACGDDDGDEGGTTAARATNRS